MPDVKITANEDGPYKIETDRSIQLEDHEGRPIPTRGRGAIFLCRCGGSKTKPFCDGTHSRIGFTGARAAVEAATRDEA